MKKCFVMVGIPAVGKSTFRGNIENSNEKSFFGYSTDDYIEEQAKAQNKTYTEVFTSVASKAKTHMDALLKDAIKEGTDIYWDQTNLSKGKRRKIINQMSKAGYEVACICFYPPSSKEELTEWHRRLDSRKDKTIPSHILKSMINSYEKPSVEEGFSEVKFYNTFGDKS